MSATKRSPPSAAQPSPVPLFRLTAQQKTDVLQQPVGELGVQGIFGHRLAGDMAAGHLAGDRLDYLMQWAGGGYDQHISWVKAKNASNCSELVASYWAGGCNNLTNKTIAACDPDCCDEDVSSLITQ
jgi:hypothetical protein